MGLRKRGTVWYVRYVDQDGRHIEQKGSTDKRVAEEVLRAALSKVVRIKAGIIDERELIRAKHQERPILDHLDEWRAHLVAKGGTLNHANLSRNRAARILGSAKAKRTPDLTPSKVQAALKDIRETGLSAASVGHHVRAIKGFSRWLHRDGRTADDPLIALSVPSPETDRRRIRRALTDNEQSRLIEAAENGSPFESVSGKDRAMLYRVALGTGFRIAELASLTPESFDLVANPPTATVGAGYSKRRRKDVQPIRPELAAALSVWIAGKAPRARIWPIPSVWSAKMIRIDLEAARVPYCDTSGHYADFHALRHSFISSLALSSAPVKIVQSLARHSTPVLTLNVYAHVGTADQAGALNALPDLTRINGKPTGGPEAGPESCPSLAHSLPIGGVRTIRRMTVKVGTRSIRRLKSRTSKTAEMSAFVANDRNFPECRRWESNPHSGYPETDFKSVRDFRQPPQNKGDRHEREESCPSLAHFPKSIPDDLSEIIDAWTDLSEPIRGAVLAIVRDAWKRSPAE